jgi:hypothetical protein
MLHCIERNCLGEKTRYVCSIRELGWLSRYCYGLHGRGGNLNSTACRLTLGSTQPPIQWALGALSPGPKWPGREDDSSPPSFAEVKNVGAISPLPSTMTSLPFSITSQTALWGLEALRVTLKPVWECQQAISVLSLQNKFILHWVHGHSEIQDTEMQMLWLKRDQIIYCLILNQQFQSHRV